jgi:N-acylglucosamine 2-epimerase
MSTFVKTEIETLLESIKLELYGNVLPFWLNYSFDEVNGGFFNNLAQYGEVFDSRKHLWLQGRQCFMFARIANTHTEEELSTLFTTYTRKVAEMKVEKTSTSQTKRVSKAIHTPLPFTRQSLISSARKGVQFLLDHAFQENGHVLFALDQSGQPALHQRKIFSATFLIMAFAEVSKACNEPVLFDRAKALFDDVLSWVKDPSALGKPGCSGSIPYQPLNVPMILLNVVNEMATCIPTGHSLLTPPASLSDFYKDTVDWCASRILLHANASKGKGCLENILPDGTSDFSTPDGRLLNPGHSIEAGWFLLEHARKRNDSVLEKRAREIIDESFAVGWDTDFGNGGFIYFRDIEGYDPTLLEKDSKLWWPMCEAMIAYAMAAETGIQTNNSEPYDTNNALQRYKLISEWALSHFSDIKHGGEWFGYLDRDGRMSHSFKGGPYKGCFHVPRALLFVEQALTRVLQEKL